MCDNLAERSDGNTRVGPYHRDECVCRTMDVTSCHLLESFLAFGTALLVFALTPPMSGRIARGHAHIELPEALVQALPIQVEW